MCEEAYVCEDHGLPSVMARGLEYAEQDPCPTFLTRDTLIRWAHQVWLVCDR